MTVGFQCDASPGPAANESAALLVAQQLRTVLVAQLDLSEDNIEEYSCVQLTAARRRLLGGLVWDVALSVSVSLAAVGFESGDAFGYAAQISDQILSSEFEAAMDAVESLSGLSVDPLSVAVAPDEEGKTWTRAPSPFPTLRPSPSANRAASDDAEEAEEDGTADDAGEADDAEKKDDAKAASSSSLLIMVCGGAVLILAVCCGAKRMLRKTSQPPAIKLTDGENAPPTSDGPIEWRSPTSAAAAPPSLGGDSAKERRRSSNFAFTNPLKNITSAGSKARKTLFG